VTSPSLSPENPHPFGTSLAMGPTMDQQILRDLFASVGEAARALDVDRELQAAVGEDPCPAGADADR
jgi:alpha-L-fucosidase 2